METCSGLLCDASLFCRFSMYIYGWSKALHSIFFLVLQNYFGIPKFSMWWFRSGEWLSWFLLEEPTILNKIRFREMAVISISSWKSEQFIYSLIKIPKIFPIKALFRCIIVNTWKVSICDFVRYLWARARKNVLKKSSRSLVVV